MRNIWTFILSISFVTTMIPQEGSGSLKSRWIKHDSLWYWHPFSVDLLVGSRVPIGELSSFQKPGITVGGGLGIMIIPRLRFSFFVNGHWSPSKKQIIINANGKSNDAFLGGGGGIGGTLTYIFYQNEYICAEILTGISKDGISTNVINQNPKDKYDSLVSIDSWGMSLGFITWFNFFNGLNFGVKTEYKYSNNNSSNYLLHTIGGHSGTIAIIYRLGRRRPENKRYY